MTVVDRKRSNMARPQRFSGQKALQILMEIKDDDSDMSDVDTDNSISDKEYEQELASSSDDDLPAQKSKEGSAHQINDTKEMNNTRDLEKPTADMTEQVAVDCGPDTSSVVDMHVDACIDAVVRRYCVDFEGADSTIWMKNSQPDDRRQAVNVMRLAGGLSAYGRRQCDDTARSNFEIFMNDELLDIVVECTNDKARANSVVLATDRQELKTYIGVSVLIGVYKGREEPVRSLWSSTECRQCISQFMGRVRFELLTKYLRFDLTSTRQRRR